MCVPTFLGIGAARSGTTWVHHMLGAHPEVFVPSTTKELHFFDREVLHHGWSWYLDQFRGGADHPARGEFTPDYARLGDPAVRAIARLLPELRLIFIIRNPVDRTISQLRNFTTQRRPRARAGELIRHVVERRSSRLRNDYLSTIDRWVRAFSTESLAIVLYDELVADPVRQLATLAEHLGVDPSFQPPDDLIHTRVSVRPDRVSELPEENFIRWYLARMWVEPVRALNDRLEGRVSHWVADLEMQLDAPWAWRIRRQVRRWVLFPPWDTVYSFHDHWRAQRVSSAVTALAPRR